MALDYDQEDAEDTSGQSTGSPTSVQGQRAEPFQQQAVGALQQASMARSDMDTARAQMLSQMQQAGARLRDLQLGPTQEEMNMRLASAWTQPQRSGRGSDAMSGVYAQQAANLQSQREAELYRMQLMSQYGMAPAQMAYQQAQQRYQDAINAERAGALAAGRNYGQETSLARQGWQMLPDGSIQYRPGAEQTVGFQNWLKQFGHNAVKVQNPDGTYTLRPATQFTPPPNLPQNSGVTSAPNAGSAPTIAAPSAATVPPAGAGAQPAAGPMPGRQPAVRQAPPGSAGQQGSLYHNIYNAQDTPNLPGTVFSSPAFDNAYEQATRIAFSPQGTAPYATSTSAPGMGMGMTAVNKAQIAADTKYKEDEMKRVEPMVESAKQNMVTAEEMMSDLNSHAGVLTGSWATLGNDIKAKLIQLGMMSPEDAERISNGQEFTKYARQLAASGLKTTYGGRVTNMELDQALKSNPNADLTDRAIRLLLQMEVQKDQQILHEQAFRSEYFNNPRLAPTKFQNFYDHYLNPYTGSTFSQLAAQQTGAPLNFTSPMRNRQGAVSVLAPVDEKGRVLVHNKSGYGYVDVKNPTDAVEVKVQ